MPVSTDDPRHPGPPGTLHGPRDARLPRGLSASWTLIRRGPRTAVVRRDFAPSFRDLGLIRAADLPPTELSPRARPFRPAGGRGELALVPAGDLGEAVVRPCRRGGLAAKVTATRFLLGDRAFRELGLTIHFRRAGVPAVEPLAAVQSSRRPGYRAAVVTRFLPDAEPAPEVLARAGDADRPAPLRGALRRMGRSTRGLHEAGGHHADLNAHNFLLPTDRTRPAVLLDFDRARALRPPLPWPLARWSLRRLRRSLAKLEVGRALREWDAFEEGYRDPPDDRPSA